MNKGIDISINNSHTLCMKTAVSIPDHIFEEVDKLARENKTSRSRIFCIAIEEYLKIIKACKMRDALNSAYADEETIEEIHLRKKSMEYFRKKIVKNNNDDQTG
ncbi:MAG: ribbon-helix-helix domain-containing protein [Acidobacteria bacterium]|nr:ribbon-helix-helix domain-containing protein [Acidobacteriota bacterium]